MISFVYILLIVQFLLLYIQNEHLRYIYILLKNLLHSVIGHLVSIFRLVIENTNNGIAKDPFYAYHVRYGDQNSHVKYLNTIMNDSVMCKCLYEYNLLL